MYMCIYIFGTRPIEGGHFKEKIWSNLIHLCSKPKLPYFFIVLVRASLSLKFNSGQQMLQIMGEGELRKIFTELT